VAGATARRNSPAAVPLCIPRARENLIVTPMSSVTSPYGRLARDPRFPGQRARPWGQPVSCDNLWFGGDLYRPRARKETGRAVNRPGAFFRGIDPFRQFRVRNRPKGKKAHRNGLRRGAGTSEPGAKVREGRLCASLPFFGGFVHDLAEKSIPTDRWPVQARPVPSCGGRVKVRPADQKICRTHRLDHGTSSLPGYGSPPGPTASTDSFSLLIGVNNQFRGRLMKRRVTAGRKVSRYAGMRRPTDGSRVLTVPPALVVRLVPGWGRYALDAGRGRAE